MSGHVAGNVFLAWRRSLQGRESRSRRTDLGQPQTRESKITSKITIKIMIKNNNTRRSRKTGNSVSKMLHSVAQRADMYVPILHRGVAWVVIAGRRRHLARVRLNWAPFCRTDE